MRIALGFWGITRSLKYTIQSIKQHIIEPMQKQNIEIIIYMHTYSVKSTYNNIRTNELHIQLDNDEYKLLNPHYIQIDDQDEIKKQINIHQYRTHPDPWNTNYNSVDNFICAMYSKQQLVNMIMTSNHKFDYVMFLRPDVLYKNPINTALFNHVRNHTICVPNFALYYQFNDRFAITNMITYKIYGAIFNDLLEYSKHCSLHSEQCQSRILQRTPMRLVYIPVFFNRVRFNGNEIIDVTLDKKEPLTKKSTYINNAQQSPNIKMNMSYVTNSKRHTAMKLFIM